METIILSLSHSPTFELVLKLIMALFLGMSLGIERAIVKKTAGMRTYGLVSMGSALLVMVGTMAAVDLDSTTVAADTLRFSAQIISGIGFIGAGLIFFKDKTVTGVTTAAGIWVAAGIGMAVGYDLYTLAIVATVIALLVFTVLWSVEVRIKEFAQDNDND